MLTGNFPLSLVTPTQVRGVGTVTTAGLKNLFRPNLKLKKLENVSVITTVHVTNCNTYSAPYAAKGYEIQRN